MSVCYQNATIIQGIIVLGHTVHHAWIVLQSSQELVQSCEQLLANDTSSLHYPAVAALFYQALNLILCEEECWPCDLLLSAMKATVLPARCVCVYTCHIEIELDCSLVSLHFC